VPAVSGNYDRARDAITAQVQKLVDTIGAA
jgi:hypothetical protein